MTLDFLDLKKGKEVKGSFSKAYSEEKINYFVRENKLEWLKPTATTLIFFLQKKVLF